MQELALMRKKLLVLIKLVLKDKLIMAIFNFNKNKRALQILRLSFLIKYKLSKILVPLGFSTIKGNMVLKDRVMSLVCK